MTQTAQSITGVIFEIQRFSIHDGPGIRTTVFMKGCPLRCKWCHNPESMSKDLQLSFMPDKCIGCGFCFKHCKQDCHRMENGRHVLDRSNCIVCGSCTEECYAGALEMVGREITVEETIDEVMRDEPFYANSEGGMTLSGGEPLLQFDYSLACLKLAKERGLHNCMETCSHVAYERIEAVMPYVDLFLCDFKETDPEKHKAYTGVTNERIQANIRQLDKDGGKMLLRCPIIPGLNDRDDHFAGIAAFAKDLNNLQGVELMPYHRLGESKLDRMGMIGAERAESHAPSKEEIVGWAQKLADLSIDVINELE